MKISDAALLWVATRRVAAARRRTRLNLHRIEQKTLDLKGNKRVDVCDGRWPAERKRGADVHQHLARHRPCEVAYASADGRGSGAETIPNGACSADKPSSPRVSPGPRVVRPSRKNGDFGGLTKRATGIEPATFSLGSCAQKHWKKRCFRDLWNQSKPLGVPNGLLAPGFARVDNPQPEAVERVSEVLSKGLVPRTSPLVRV